MKSRLVVASCIGLLALPLLCVAQNEEETAPADTIIQLDP